MAMKPTAPVSPVPARVALALLVLPLLALVAGLNYRAQRRVDDLVQHGVRVEAAVAGTYCSNHGSLAYAFQVSGRTYRGSGTGCVASCRDARSGDPLMVTYSPADPGNSECGLIRDAQQRVHGNNSVLGVFSILVAMVIYRVTRTR